MAGVSRLLPFDVVAVLLQRAEKSCYLAGELERLVVPAQHLVLRGERRVVLHSGQSTAIMPSTHYDV